MARTKRKINPLYPVVETPVQVVAFKTAAYVRLSIEDSGKPGADTIETQTSLLLSHIDRLPDVELVDIYCDNGCTGTNFKRPEFERMMEDVRRGKINCIIVKDLSRFGRTYLETNNYLLRIFPLLGVRFISVNENFDTATAVQTEYGLVMPLKNIINDTYSRDISRKVSSAIKTKQERGEFVGVYAPYGYSKSEEDRHRLVSNPETAPVVREIFSLRLQGMGYAGIARSLNARGIPSPGAYLFQRGLSARENYRDSMWAVWNIKEILSSEVYLGHLIQGKRTKASYKHARIERYAPADEWRICRNVHEPLVDNGTFEAVQKLAGESRQRYTSMLGKADELKTPNLFRKLIYCADCGKAMSRRHIYSNWREERHYYYNFYCATSVKLPSACTPKNLPETKLLEIVADTIFTHLAAVAKLEYLVNEVWADKTFAERTAVAQRIAEAEQELSRYMKLLEGLYERLAEGIISRQEYQSLKEHYHNQYREAKARCEALKQQEQDILRFGPGNPMFRTCHPHYAASELTEELVHTLIARISVHDHNCIDISLVYQDEFLAAVRFLEGVSTS